jgi:hypothetical protein
VGWEGVSSSLFTGVSVSREWGTERGRGVHGFVFYFDDER